MYCNRSIRFRWLLAASAFALSSGVAFADDSSMSRWTGDSYAFFNNLEYRAGKFNVARAPQDVKPGAAVAARDGRVAHDPMMPRATNERANRSRRDHGA